MSELAPSPARAAKRLPDRLYIDGRSAAGEGERICVINPGTVSGLARERGVEGLRIYRQIQGLNIQGG